jgi:hypothetical protein
MLAHRPLPEREGKEFAACIDRDAVSGRMRRNGTEMIGGRDESS